MFRPSNRELHQLMTRTEHQLLSHMRTMRLHHFNTDIQQFGYFHGCFGSPNPRKDFQFPVRQPLHGRQGHIRFAGAPTQTIQ